jgi:hypothetical protein
MAGASHPRGWRFYFEVLGDTYVVTEIIPHPK